MCPAAAQRRVGAAAALSQAGGAQEGVPFRDAAQGLWLLDAVRLRQRQGVRPGEQPRRVQQQQLEQPGGPQAFGGHLSWRLLVTVVLCAGRGLLKDGTGRHQAARTASLRQRPRLLLRLLRQGSAQGWG